MGKFSHNPDMHDAESKSTVEIGCLGRQRCTIKSEPSAAFKDPSPERQKWLTARLRCAKEKAAPNPMCCPADTWVQDPSAAPADTLCIGKPGGPDETPCALFGSPTVRPCLLPTKQHCHKVCLNMDNWKDGDGEEQHAGIDPLGCHKLCIKVVQKASKFGFTPIPGASTSSGSSSGVNGAPLKMKNTKWG